MAVGGNIRFATLQQIADLFRSQVDDDFAGATNTPGEGLINFNTAPHLLTFMNSAIRDMYSDLRNVGDPELLLDNYILTGIPALAAPDPTVQVSLDSTGYFNGQTVDDTWMLPAGCMKIERMWERTSMGAGNQNSFVPMAPAPFGMAGVMQGQRMGTWEVRQNAIWMPGCLVSVDLRIRCRVTFPDFFNPETLDFTTTYVPILDCINAVVDKMCVRYARRFAPDMYQMSKDSANESIGKLRLEVVRQMQTTEYQRAAFGEEATADFAASWTNL